MSVSSPSNLPLDVLDAHFLARFLIVVKPLAFCQVNASEGSSRVYALGLPFTLCIVSRGGDSAVILTSALNSVNSRPLQSITRMLKALAGLCCEYALGASIMFAECCLCNESACPRACQHDVPCSSGTSRRNWPRHDFLIARSAPRNGQDPGEDLETSIQID